MTRDIAAQSKVILAESIPDPITLFLQLFKLDLVMMSIVILCILSAALYQGISWLEKRVS